MNYTGLIRGILTLVILTHLACTISAQPVKNYHVYYSATQYQNKELIILREFEQQGQKRFLAVNPDNLDTFVIPGAQITANALSWPAIVTRFKNTPYIKAVEAAQNQAKSVQDAGIIHGYPKQKGISLTIDLCPSHKPLDRIIFTSIIAEFKKIEKPVPVALSITGRFMLTHGDDISWLTNLEKEGDIDIIWVNHTYNHHFSKSAPLKNNFLLAPGTDINFEIMGTEIAMLQHGLLPSVFFRFPGLVSDAQLVDKVGTYGLITVGSDAWLAKGQNIANGSIVLIHGNGNEPIGVTDFIKLLKAQDTAIVKHQWLLYDLRENIDDEFQK